MDASPWITESKPVSFSLSTISSRRELLAKNLPENIFIFVLKTF